MSLQSHIDRGGFLALFYYFMAILPVLFEIYGFIRHFGGGRQDLSCFFVGFPAVSISNSSGCWGWMSEGDGYILGWVSGMDEWSGYMW
jgi:hypothetical protein